MPRTLRADEAGGLCHTLTRGNAPQTIFRKDEDHEAFEKILAEGLDRYPAQWLAYQLMSNHWNLVLRPTEDGGMSNLLRWGTCTHALLYYSRFYISGEGHLYQGRFRGFPVKATLTS